MDAEHRAEQKQRIISAMQAGELLDLSGSSPDQNDPAQGVGWDDDRIIDSDLLAEIVTSAPPEATGRARPVKIRGARFSGPLDLEACALARPLLLQNCYFDEVVNLDEATATVIRLPGCHLPALTARQLSTAGDLELNKGFTTTRIDLLGARIAGKLSLSGAHLTNPGATVLNGDRATIEQGMFCREGFTADGEVRLLSARIDGQFDLSGARLTNPGRTALQAGWLTVGTYMLCTSGFTAEGTISLASARVGYLNLRRATLAAPGSRALNCHGLTVQGDFDCRDGFTADGEINLTSAHIGGRVTFSSARISNPRGLALNLGQATARALVLRPRRTPVGGVDLTNAHVGAFSDDPGTWASGTRLHGFTYDTLENDDVDTRTRLSRLADQPGGYTPQPYDQLTTAYRRDGREEAARRVAIAKQWQRRKVLNPVGKLTNWLLYLTVGYGYRTWLAALWLTGLLALGTWQFSHAHPQHMTPTGQKPPAFNAFAYTLDLLPVIDLGQQKAWQAHGFALYLTWILIAASWVLTTTVVAGITGLIKRQ